MKALWSLKTKFNPYGFNMAAFVYDAQVKGLVWYVIISISNEFEG